MFPACQRTLMGGFVEQEQHPSFGPWPTLKVAILTEEIKTKSKAGEQTKVTKLCCLSQMKDVPLASSSDKKHTRTNKTKPHTPHVCWPRCAVASASHANHPRGIIS